MTYAQACEEFERLARHCRGRERLELRADGRGGYRITGCGAQPAAYGGVMCPALRCVAGNDWRHRRADGRSLIDERHHGWDD